MLTLNLSVSFVPCMLSYSIFWSQTSLINLLTSENILCAPVFSVDLVSHKIKKRCRNVSFLRVSVVYQRRPIYEDVNPRRRIFGCLARAASSCDHDGALRTIVHGLLKSWKPPTGRPRSTESDL